MVRALLFETSSVAFVLTTLSCLNYVAVGRHVLPITDLVCACGLVVSFPRLRVANNPVPARIGCLCLGARWIDSILRLATQGALTPVMWLWLVAQPSCVATWLLMR